MRFGTLQFAAPAIAGFYRRPEVGDAIRVAALSFLFAPFGAINSAIFQREMRFKETAVSEWSFAVVFPVVAVGLALSGLGFWSIVYGQLAARASEVAVKMYQGRWRPRLHFSRAAFREIAPFGAGVAANRLLGFASENLDSIIVGRLFGIVALGFYDKAFNTMTNLTDKLVVDPGVTFRIFAIISEDRERFHRAYRKVVLSTAIVGLPFFAAMILMAPELLLALYGPAMDGVDRAVPIVVRRGRPTYRECIFERGDPGAWICLGGFRSLHHAQHHFGDCALRAAALGDRGRGGRRGVRKPFEMVMTQTLLNRLVGLHWSQLAAPILPGVTCTAILVPALIAVEVILRAVLGTPSIYVVLGAKAATALVIFLSFVVSVRIAGMSDVVSEILTDLAPLLHGPYVRVHRKLRGVGPAVDAQKDVA